MVNGNAGADFKALQFMKSQRAGYLPDRFELKRSNLFLSVAAALIICLVGCAFRAAPDPVTANDTPRFDLSRLDDGIYRGISGKADTQYTVDIVIEAHAIKEITITGGSERLLIKKCAFCETKAMIQDAIKSQSLPVDAYSGATQTTSAVMEAVENALTPPYKRPADAPNQPETAE